MSEYLASAMESVQTRIANMTTELKSVNDRMESEGATTGLKQRGANLLVGIAKAEAERDDLHARLTDSVKAGLASGRYGVEAGSPGRPDTWTPSTRNLRDRKTLAKGESAVDWVKALGRDELPAGITSGQAWQAFSKGLIGDDWSDWKDVQASGLKAMSTAEPGGGYLAPEILSADVIDRMRASTPIFAAGATLAPMTSSTLDLARVTGDPTAAWKNEGAAITPSDVSLDRVRFVARTLPVIVKASVELAEDAPNLGDVVASSIAGAIGVELTRVALRGSGVAPEPLGIRNQSGVTLTALGANGGAVTWTVMANAVRDILNVNAFPTGYVGVPRTLMALELQADTTGQFIPPPPSVKALDVFPTTVLPTNLVKGTSSNATELYVGDWRQLLVGMRTTLAIRRLNERYADDLSVGFLAYLRADIQLAHGPAFNVITDAIN